MKAVLVLLMTMTIAGAVQAAPSNDSNANALCGASINGKTLTMTYNPLTGRYSSDDAEERVLLFLEVTRTDRIRLAMVETLPGQPRRFTQMWVGYTEGIAHIEFSQDGGYELSISCQRLSGTALAVAK